MFQGDISEILYLSSENPYHIPENYFDGNSPSPVFRFNEFLSSFPPFPSCDFAPPSSLSNNSASDEAEEQMCRIINERKRRRMISNRESARRSRMRKRKHLDELRSEMVWLRFKNTDLIDRLGRVMESHQSVVKENLQLKEEADDLRQMLIDLHISSPYTYGLGEIKEY